VETRSGLSERTGRSQSNRRATFVVSPGEPVASPILTTTLLPHTSAARTHLYRTVLLAMLAVTMLAVTAGELGFAFVAAACTVPILYTLYLLDVNVWEDQPALVLALVGVLSAGLGALLAWLVRTSTVLGDQGFSRSFVGELRIRRLVVLGVGWAVVAVAAMQIGPMLLASRDRFNHLLDGLTFGFLAGSAFLAGDTLVAQRGALSGVARTATSQSLGSWIPLALDAAVIRPLLFGTITALALAEFCGIGPGAGRFSNRHWRTFAEVTGVAVVYSVGLGFLELVDGSAGLILSLLWGTILVIAGNLRLRIHLHDALLEEAADALAIGSDAPRAQRERLNCEHCGSAVDGKVDHFCSTCGMATAANTKPSSRPASRGRTAPLPTITRSDTERSNIELSGGVS
jgi:hypothetical protein